MVSILSFLIAIIVHECAHGLVAYWLGDDTARLEGRLTLDPRAHIDLIGTILLPLVLVISHSPVVFGWAKPIPVNARNFIDPKKGLFLTGAAGPAANMLLAAFSAILLRSRLIPMPFISYILVSIVLINLIVGVFNLIPIPPLDGSRILVGLLPNTMARLYIRLEPYGFIVLLTFLYLGLLDRAIFPLVAFLSKALLI